jgi:hypothetical protein
VATSPELKYLDRSLSIDVHVDDLVSRMTLEEKVSQMTHDAPAIERLGIPPVQLVVIVGALGLAGVVVFFAWDLHQHAADPRLLAYHMEQIQREMAEQQRHTWQVIAQISRASQAGDDSRSVMIYREKQE